MMWELKEKRTDQLRSTRFRSVFQSLPPPLWKRVFIRTQTWKLDKTNILLLHVCLQQVCPKGSPWNNFVWPPPPQVQNGPSVALQQTDLMPLTRNQGTETMWVDPFYTDFMWEDPDTTAKIRVRSKVLLGAGRVLKAKPLDG
ncbi:hypothetical protein GOODEAATRI_030592 [Goodea atripinnis]|uniref:Uncharacterized protein n=1 Tax=Goodea atripinnis TaxID=208336 RepID=A0ABV0PSY5_9TELE